MSGIPPIPAHMLHPTAPPPLPVVEEVCDTECYRNYWLCGLDSHEFEIFNGTRYIDGQPVDLPRWISELTHVLRTRRVVTFNGVHYDMPIIALALGGATEAQLKSASDSIIVHGVKSWDIADVPKWIDHIDLFDVSPGQGSLKAYGGKMHSRKLQDLPYPPDAIITPEMRTMLRLYCGNDRRTTRDMLETFPTQLALRVGMSAEYGVDLRSKSDAQIAEAVMRKILPFKVERPAVPYGQSFYYRPPEWLSFIRLTVLDLLARSPFTISDKGSPVMTEELANSLIRIGDNAYQMGSGGLHSTESSVCNVADEQYMLSDHDVASYYPSLILRTGIYPKQIGPAFVSIYRDWYTRRLAAKAAGDKKNANSLKTLLNGTFGKLGSQYSIFYAPSEMIQVTITGQLALLMLIERLEMCGIRVISANTDGIVLRTHRNLIPMRDSIIKWWEQTTGMETEANLYRLLASRDVNSYVAIKPDGEVKTKGAFAPPEPGPSGWPNPTGQISVDAAVAWLRDGTDIATTVRACADVRQFLHVRNVKGGGSYCQHLPLGKKPTGAAMLTMFPDPAGRAWRQLSVDEKAQVIARYEAAVAEEAQHREYLGKVVRWYYASDSQGCIVTPTGALVARSEGCRPMMELLDELPADIDYGWYIEEAKNMLRTMGAAIDAPSN